MSEEMDTGESIMMGTLWANMGSGCANAGV